MTTTPHVYVAMHEVLAAMSEEGIEKSRRGDVGQYRGIDDVYNALSAALVKAKLLVRPTAVDRERTLVPRDGKAPAIMTVVQVTYTFTSAVDGTSCDVVMHAEGTDFSDKSTGKAFSYAYKQMAFQTFCIPIEGHSPDSDGESPELPPVQRPAPPPRQPPAQRPAPPAAAPPQRSASDERYKHYWRLFRDSSSVFKDEDGKITGSAKLTEVPTPKLAAYIARLDEGLARNTVSAKAQHADARLYKAAAELEMESRLAEEDVAGGMPSDDEIAF